MPNVRCYRFQKVYKSVTMYVYILKLSEESILINFAYDTLGILIGCYKSDV